MPPIAHFVYSLPSISLQSALNWKHFASSKCLRVTIGKIRLIKEDLGEKDETVQQEKTTALSRGSACRMLFTATVRIVVGALWLLTAAVRMCSEALGPDTIVTMAGLCNTYASYVTTYEEYQAQRYEGASTIYGPHTLDAYLQELRALATAIRTNATVPPGPDPPNLLDQQIGFLPEVVVDAPPFGSSFGDVVSGCDAAPIYSPGARAANDPKS